MRRKLYALMTLALMLALAASAGAVDGTIEINQAKVLAAGGFPFKIDGVAHPAGSYRLTGNLTVAAAATDAIDVSVSNVTIDLNGFAITGPGGSTAGDGINGSSANQMTVENGTVTLFTYGIWEGANGIVRNVHADSNYSYGIYVGSNGNVVGCTASNGGGAIWCYAWGCAISNNTATNNALGIYCTNGACNISGNTVSFGYSVGISINGSGNLVVHNTVVGNSGVGLQANDATTGYGENVFQGNNGGGAQVSGGHSLGASNTNLCNGVGC